MGWLFQDTPLRHETPAQYLAREFTHDNEHHRAEVLAASRVGGAVYMTVRQTDKGRTPGAHGHRYVFAAVILVRNTARDGFGHKDMCESMGPCEADCPDGILRLLSPVADIPCPGSTAAWRAEVGRRKAERAAARAHATDLVAGTHLRFSQPLRFRGFEAGLFELVPPRPRRRRPVFLAVGHGVLCRLRPERIAAAERLPPPRNDPSATRRAAEPPEGAEDHIPNAPSHPQEGALS